MSQVKSAPREYPVCPELMAILREHRQQRRGRGSSGWMFPSRVGGLRTPSSLAKAWRACLVAAGVKERFTVHGLRRTFVDLARRAKVDGVVTRSLTGHVTMKMHLHYSTVGIDEKRAAVEAISGLVGNPRRPPWHPVGSRKPRESRGCRGHALRVVTGRRRP